MGVVCTNVFVFVFSDMSQNKHLQLSAKKLKDQKAVSDAGVGEIVGWGEHCVLCSLIWCFR